MDDYDLWQVERKIKKLIEDNEMEYVRGNIGFYQHYEKEKELKSLLRDIRGY